MSDKQKWYISHAETITQNVLGLLIGFLILWWFGMSTSESLQIQAVFFFASYTRGYLVRRFFNRMGG